MTAEGSEMQGMESNSGCCATYDTRTGTGTNGQLGATSHSVGAEHSSSMTTTVEVLVLDQNMKSSLNVPNANIPSNVHLDTVDTTLSQNSLSQVLNTDLIHRSQNGQNNYFKPVICMTANNADAVSSSEHGNQPLSRENCGKEAARSISFTSTQENPPFLSTDINTAEAVTFQQELYVNSDLQEKALNGDADSEVILVYQDVLTCGLCSKQFLDMLEFLEHKVEHTLGNSFYRCELCKLFFLKQSVLISHYRKRHRLPNFGDGLLLTLSRESGPGQEEDQQGLHGDVQHVSEGNSSVDSDAVEGQDQGIVAVKCDATSEAQTLTKDNTQPEAAKKIIEIKPTCHNNEFGANATTGMTVDGESHTIEILPSDIANSNGALSNTDLFNGSTDCTIQVSLLPDNDELVKGSNEQKSKSCDATVPALCKQEQESSLTKSDKEKSQDFNFILLTEHVRGSNFGYGKIWFKCLHCEFKTQSKAALTRHMHDRHEDMLDVHKMITVYEKQENSNKKVMKMSAYEALPVRDPITHRWGGKTKPKSRCRFDRQDLPGVYPCNDCGKVFHRLRYLRKHAMVHKTDKKFLCDECGKAFKSKNLLTQHRKIHDKVKLFRCNQCDFQSRVNAAIHAHRQIHSQGSVLCDICGYAYTDKSTLNKHMRVHDVNRPFACNFPGCTWRFKTEMMCRAHIRAHTTEGKFKCSYCGYAFRHKHHLIRHESNTHNVKRSKNRTPPTSVLAEEVMDSEIIDTVNLVVDPDNLQVAPEALSEHHLVVTTDNSGTPITCTYETAEEPALNVAYQYHTLMQGAEVQGNDKQTILLTQPDTHIVFQQE